MAPVAILEEPVNNSRSGQLQTCGELEIADIRQEQSTRFEASGPGLSSSSILLS